MADARRPADTRRAAALRFEEEAAGGTGEGVREAGLEDGRDPAVVTTSTHCCTSPNKVPGAIVALATAGVRGLTPYQPGKPIEELERELGITGIIKLASNIVFSLCQVPIGLNQSVKLSSLCQIIKKSSNFHIDI